jgi:hypothetical protein
MLKRTPPDPAPASAHASREKRKRTLGRAAPPLAIQDPGTDWVPIERALFWYGRSGYIRSAEDWKEELRIIVTRFIESGRENAQKIRDMTATAAALFEIKGSVLEEKLRMADVPSESEWSLEVSERRQAEIKALGWRLGIDGEGATIGLRGPDRYFSVVGSPAEFLPRKYEVMPSAGAWHFELADSIIRNFRWKVLHCMRRGAAHIMARKNAVLAPFERVTWDQWTYFQLDEQKREERARKNDGRFLPPDWFLPYRFRREDQFSTATGPAGEKLYAIHIAPGVARIAESSDGNDAEDECLQALLELMREFPDRPPKPLPELAKQACSAFPELSERGFYRCLLLAQNRSGNRNWSKPGAFPKSPQKSPHKN